MQWRKGVTTIRSWERMESKGWVAGLDEDHRVVVPLVCGTKGKEKNDMRMAGGTSSRE